MSVAAYVNIPRGEYISFCMSEASQTIEQAGEDGVLASLGLNGQLFLFQLVNFAIVVVVIWFFILKPLTKKMEERKRMIDDSLDKAKEIETNFQMSEQKYQERIDEAKVEANRVIERAHDAIEAMKEVMKKKTKEEIDLLVQQAKRNIEIDRQDMRDQIRAEAVTLITMAVEKILGETLDSKKDAERIQNSLKDIV